MRSSRFLAVLSVCCWLLALGATFGVGGSRTWLLVDRSASMGDAVQPADLASGVAASRAYAFAEGLGPESASSQALGSRERSRLGAALDLLRKRLRPGDELRIYTDGRATDRLPEAWEWAGIRIRAVAPPPRPRLSPRDPPLCWPSAGSLVLDLRLENARLEDGELEVGAWGGAGSLDARLGPWHGTGASTFTARLEVRDPAPPRPSGLALRWRGKEGESSFRLPLGPPLHPCADSSREAWRKRLRAAGFPAPPSGAEARIRVEPVAEVDPVELGVLLDRGELVLLVGSRAGDWADLPPAWQPFRPAPPPGRRLLLLLDHSGSMAGAPLREARAAVRRWADWWPTDFGFRVLPFAAETEAPWDPRTATGRAALAALQAFGPTALAAALDEVSRLVDSRTVLVILGDGRAEAPPQGWSALGEGLRARAGAVYVVPVGEDPRREVLRSLGRIPAPGEGLRRQLDLAFQGGREALRSAPLHARPGALWTLPLRFEAGTRPPLRSAPGAEVLLEDADGLTGAALLRRGSGLLVGLAASDSAPWEELLAPLAAEMGRPRLRRVGEWVELRAPGRGWRVEIPGEGGSRPFEADPAGDSRAGPFAPTVPLIVRGPRGSRVELPPRPMREGEAPADPWQSWLEAQRAFPRHRPLSPGWLLAALSLSVGVAAATALERKNRNPATARD